MKYLNYEVFVLILPLEKRKKEKKFHLPLTWLFHQIFVFHVVIYFLFCMESELARGSDLSAHLEFA